MFIGVEDPRVTPVRIATVLAACIGIALAAYGSAGNDPVDGILRGLVDAGACLTGFVVLGRYLGLRAPTPAHGQTQTT